MTIKSVQIVKKNGHDYTSDSNFFDISKTEKIPIQKILYIKDKLLISDKKYASIRNDFQIDNLPTLDELFNFRMKLNSEIRTSLVRPDSNSLFTDIVGKINKYCLSFLSNLNSEQLKDTKSIRIKISADGTRCGNNINLINFTFQLINIIQLNMSPSSVSNVRTLGLAECSEKYDELKTIFDYVSLCLKVYSNIDYIEFSGMRFKIELFFVADWKLTACILGLQCANSNYPCIWCHWKKPKPEKNGPPKNPRETERPKNTYRNEEDRESFQGKTVNFGYNCQNLLPGFNLDFILIDTLHLKLRVADRLLELLIFDLAELDNFESGLIDASCINLTNWFKFLNACKIRRELIPYNKKNSAGITRDFTGGEYDKIFEMINILRDFPALKNGNNVQELWKSLYSIINTLDESSSEQIERSTERWYALFLGTYRKEFETPYIHAFHKHLHEQADLHGNIGIFNQQSVEKLNDLTTKEYFQGTNKHDFLEQIILRRERMDKYELENNLCF